MKNRFRVGSQYQADQYGEDGNAAVEDQEKAKCIFKLLFFTLCPIGRYIAKDRTSKPKVQKAEISDYGTSQRIQPIFLFPQHTKHNGRIDKWYDRRQGKTDIRQYDPRSDRRSNPDLHNDAYYTGRPGHNDARGTCEPADS